MTILAIDPGPEKSGWGWYRPEPRAMAGGVVSTAEIARNGDGWRLGSEALCAELLAIEEVVNFGQRIGADVIRTCETIGALSLLAGGAYPGARPRGVAYVPRTEVKQHWLGRASGTDADIWAAMRARFGEPGLKTSPGILYGIASHARSALAIAVMLGDQLSGDFSLAKRPCRFAVGAGVLV